MRYSLLTLSIVAPLLTAAAVLLLRDGPEPGLEGYCPVTLSERWLWAPGEARWSCRFEGRRYWLASPQAQAKFKADPARYAPVLSGDDPVLWIDRGWRAPGRREHGLEYAGRVWLFASEQTLREFTKRPAWYAARAEEPDAGAP